MMDSSDKTSRVPQSTSLKSVRALVQAYARGARGVKALGFAPRRICYARNASQTLGLLDETSQVTALGRRLLATDPGSPAEISVFRMGIERSEVLARIMKSDSGRLLTKAQMCVKLQSSYGFSEKTANDRISTLMSWLSQTELVSDGPQDPGTRAESRSKRSPAKAAPARTPAPPKQRRTKTSGSTVASKTGTRMGSVASPAVPQSSDEDVLVNIPKLGLPKRYERLIAESEKAEIDPLTVVQRVESAARRVDVLLRKVQDGGTGQFEIFFGASGSGKTTFLHSLPKFFQGIKVIPIRQSDGSLDSFVARVEKDHDYERKKLRVYFFADRDNESLAPAEAERFFESLRVLFRKDEGQVVVVWPITRIETRDHLSKIAWDIGADSIVPVDTKGVYNFHGIPQSQYFEVADLTVRCLNGESLEGYGVSADAGRELAKESDTIGSYFSRLEAYASERRGKVRSVLKDRIRPRLWIVVAGDNGDYLDTTISRLTQGRKYKIDVERLLEYLDDATNESNYLKVWRERRLDAAYLFRILDVRLIPLHPLGALAAFRGFGNETILKQLTAKALVRSKAIENTRRSVLYKLLLTELGGQPEPYTKGRPPAVETKNEYNRVQKIAKSSDKSLNYALCEALRVSLEQDGRPRRCWAEKRTLADTGLQPDVQIELSHSEVICIEPTWRTSGKGIREELNASSNSMNPGNIQKYTLEKVMEYVRAIGL